MPKLTKSLARRGRVLAVALIAAATLPASAAAHAGFVDSQPAPGNELEAGPGLITLEFTEPLNRGLSDATILNAETGEPVAAELSFPGERELRLVPQARLERAPYTVEWHTVSTVDGHALEGSFGFGVEVPALQGAGALEQSPLARGGWVRIAARILLYASLLLFAGGLVASVALDRSGRSPASWLFPPALADSLARVGERPAALAERTWARTLDAGWLAAGAAGGAAFVEALDAAGGLSPSALHDFLLTNSAGLARVGTVVLLLAAAALAGRRRVAALAPLGLALLTIALSGHAFSSDLAGPAVLTDWAHLVAAAVWIGGIAQLGWAWLPLVRGIGREGRHAAMRLVLPRFGWVALPAFALVVVSGATSALIQLGGLAALWETSYGRVLAVKIAFVCLIAFASYLHALRLRPRLLAANPHASDRLERRHWRLLATEPVLGLGVVVAVAALVAFPLPPRQLGEEEEALASACSPCPVPAPQRDELAIADDAGSRIIAFWLRREDGRLEGTLRMLDVRAAPTEAEVRVDEAELAECGRGCRRFSLPASARTVTAYVEEDGQEYRARVPARWRPDENRRARQLLVETQREMRSLRSLREVESLTSGPGSFVRRRYELRAPDRLAYRTSGGGQVVVVGATRWSRSPDGTWERGTFGAGDPFRSADFFRWTPYAQATRLLGVRRHGERRVAEVAIMNTAAPPIWFRLRIDLASMHTLADRMTTYGHFMERRYFAFDRPLTIEPPEVGP